MMMPHPRQLDLDRYAVRDLPPAEAEWVRAHFRLE